MLCVYSFVVKSHFKEINQKKYYIKYLQMLIQLFHVKPVYELGYRLNHGIALAVSEVVKPKLI